MICRGLENGKLSVKTAREKYEEMLDLIDEDHQEDIENLLAEHEDTTESWNTAVKYFTKEDSFYNDDEVDMYDEDEEEDSYDDE
jgi:hypothetical protein